MEPLTSCPNYHYSLCLGLTVHWEHDSDTITSFIWLVFDLILTDDLFSLLLFVYKSQADTHPILTVDSWFTSPFSLFVTWWGGPLLPVYSFLLFDLDSFKLRYSVETRWRHLCPLHSDSDDHCHYFLDYIHDIHWWYLIQTHCILDDVPGKYHSDCSVMHDTNYHWLPTIPHDTFWFSMILDTDPWWFHFDSDESYYSTEHWLILIRPSILSLIFADHSWPDWPRCSILTTFFTGPKLQAIRHYSNFLHLRYSIPFWSDLCDTDSPIDLTHLLSLPIIRWNAFDEPPVLTYVAWYTLIFYYRWLRYFDGSIFDDDWYLHSGHSMMTFIHWLILRYIYTRATYCWPFIHSFWPDLLEESLKWGHFIHPI